MYNEDGKEDKNAPASNVKLILERIFRIQLNAELPEFRDILQDTIPLFIYIGQESCPFIASGYTIYSTFQTRCFRLEDIDESTIHFSLLYPVDEEGNYTWEESAPYGLRKTDMKIKICLENIYALQCLNPKLVNRQIIVIEEKD